MKKDSSDSQDSSHKAIQTVYVTTGKPVNKISYCLLAFFFGFIGVHRFYAGKIGSGILFVLFFFTGIPALISIFDLISALSKPSDEFGNITV